MPSWGRRINYSAVTLTVCVLAVIAVLSYLGRELIPPPEPNRLSKYDAEFLSRAKYQPIYWHTTDMESLPVDLVTGSGQSAQIQEPFARAKNEDKPLMLFIGSGWSLGARRFDESVFGSPDIAARLNRDFVCVRIDLSYQPEWRGALLPISSHDGTTDPGFSVWFLQPDGQIISVVKRSVWGYRNDYESFMNALSFVSYFRGLSWDSLSETEQRELLAETSRSVSLSGVVEVPTEQALLLRETVLLRQAYKREIDYLIGPSFEQGVPDIEKFIRLITVEKGQRQFETWEPDRLRVLLQGDRSDLASASLEVADGEGDDLLDSVFRYRADLLDGGFFWLGSGQADRTVEFGKLATDQAEMAAVMAHLWRSTGDGVYEYLARRALESLFGKEDRSDSAHVFMPLDGAWPSYIDAETDRGGASPRYSLNLRRRNLELSADERDVAELLGLGRQDNPQSLLFFKSSSEFKNQIERADPLLKRLQLIADERFKSQASLKPEDRDLRPGGIDQLDSAGTSVARSLEAARALGDAGLVASALMRAKRLSAFRSGLDEVRHTLDQTRHIGTDAWLGDFTAYSDAMLEAYVTTGDVAWLEEGKRVLTRALELFATEDGSVFIALAESRPDMGELNLYLPSIVDDGQPPALPALMRLAFRYGALTGDDSLREVAVKIAQRYSPLANQQPLSFSSFIAAAQEVLLSGCFVLSGEGSLERAQALSHRRPGTFIASAPKDVYIPGVFSVVGLNRGRVDD